MPRVQHASALILTLAWVLLSTSLAWAQGFVAPPRPEHYATDRAGVIEPARLAALNERLAQFERETSNQIVVYIDRRVPEGTTLEAFANLAFNAWGVGQRGRDNGVAIFVFIDERKVRFEVGYGLEGAIPDARTVLIREDHLAPRFREQDYAGGLEQAVEQLMEAARGEPYRGSGRTAAERGGSESAGEAFPWWLSLAPLAGIGGAVTTLRGAAGKKTGRLLAAAAFFGITGVMMLFSIILTHNPQAAFAGFALMFSCAGCLIGNDAGEHLRKLKGVRQRLGGHCAQLGLTLLFCAIGSGFLAGIFEGWSIAWSFLIGLTAVALIQLSIVLQSTNPSRVATRFAAKGAVIGLGASAIACLFVLWQGAPGLLPDVGVWAAVAAAVLGAAWGHARIRQWKLFEADPAEEGPEGYSWSHSRGGSLSGSFSSSGSSSSSSGGSYSGGGGRSGGGGSSGSW